MLKSSAMAEYQSPDSKRQSLEVVKNLRELFGTVFHIDIIKSVASQCDFDVEKSSNVLLEMTNSGAEKSPPTNQQSIPTSVSSTSLNTNATSKKSQEIERVLKNIRQGYKVLVILRGLPGSGKTFLAQILTADFANDHLNHVLSTDDFFMRNGGSYHWDPSCLPEAHSWNQRRAFEAMSRGLSPVIVDNTNTELWEMRPYAATATDYGYVIEILEPDTWWCFNDKELARRNKHGVPRAKIKEMLERYQKNVTPLKLLAAYSLAYKNQKPPQFRLKPPLTRARFNQNAVPKSKSVSHFDTSVNLMEFNEAKATNGAAPKSPSKSTWSCQVDDILMCAENQPQSTILQPKKLDLEGAWGVDANVFRKWDFVTPLDSDWETVPQVQAKKTEAAKPEVKDGESVTDPFDFHYLLEECSTIPNGYSVRIAKERDINENTPNRIHTVPKKIMVDKSCFVDEEINSDATRQMNDLQDLFPKIPRSYLKDIYEKCDKNFNWTVDVLLEDNSQVTMDVTEDTEAVEAKPTAIAVVAEPTAIPKSKPTKIPSEEALELKKCLEERIDISQEHYSEHVFKVKRFKFGGNGAECQPSTSSAISDDPNSSDEDDFIDANDPKNMIEFNLGDTFVTQLETLFGGDHANMAFPKGFQPVVQIPTSLARQIYSFYVESLCQQMEAQNHILDRLVKEDEEFARKLQREEESFDAVEGATSAVPNFAEIMADQRSASVVHKSLSSEWKNLSADNLAAKLTRQKLFQHFPKIPQDSLLEILHAYDNDYNKTVEDLISSVGGEHSQTINEPPLNETTLQEMKEAEDASKVEYDEDEVEEVKPAQFYRDEANKHLRRREDLYEKARVYFQRGMSEVALFYSQLATKETQFYDKANHMAATIFSEEHSKRLQKFDTLDLHYLFVKEAIPTLDIFIDRNINLLKGSPKRGQDLFVITGRGKNSEGGVSKIKPAVISRLKRRKIGFVQLNPGLLKIRVMDQSLMTSDLP